LMVHRIMRCKVSGKTSRYNYATAKYETSSEFLTVIANSDVDTRTKRLIEEIINETNDIFGIVESAFFSNIVTSSELGITPINTIDAMVDELYDINPMLTEMAEMMFLESNQERVIKMVTKLERGR
jgi:hypothetical protein